MNKQERFLENSKSAEKVCELLGYRLISFNPNWNLESINNEVGSVIYGIGGYATGCSIADDIMGKLSLSYGFPWEFEQSNHEVIKEINGCATLAKELKERDVFLSKALKQKVTSNDVFIMEITLLERWICQSKWLMG